MTGRDHLRSLRLVQEGRGEIGMVAGAPDLGETDAILNFHRGTAGLSVLHTAGQVEGGIWNLASEPCRALWIAEPNACRLPDKRRRIGEAIGPDRLLLIGEAQNLVQRNARGRDDWQAFEWLRGIADECCIGIVFLGDLVLRQLETELPQLGRRLVRRIVVTRVPREDVQAVTAALGVTDARTVDIRCKVAAMGGALGDVVTVCRHARLLSVEGDPGLHYVLAALEDLHLMPGRVA